VVGVAVLRGGEDPCDRADRIANWPAGQAYPGGIEKYDQDFREATSACEDELAP
jgi:hypothetical protein